MSTALARLLSLEAFLALPEESPALELIDGEVAQKPASKLRHARAQNRFRDLLATHPATRDGEALSRGGTVLCWFAARKSSRAGRFVLGRVAPPVCESDGYPDTVPDLCAEVRSPGQSMDTLRGRLEFLRARGVRAGVLIDPERGTITVIEDTGERTSTGDDDVTIAAVPGFTFRVRDVLA